MKVLYMLTVFVATIILLFVVAAALYLHVFNGRHSVIMCNHDNELLERVDLQLIRWDSERSAGNLSDIKPSECGEVSFFVPGEATLRVTVFQSGQKVQLGDYYVYAEPFDNRILLSFGRDEQLVFLNSQSYFLGIPLHMLFR